MSKIGILKDFKEEKPKENGKYLGLHGLKEEPCLINFENGEIQHLSFCNGTRITTKDWNNHEIKWFDIKNDVMYSIAPVVRYPGRDAYEI